MSSEVTDTGHPPRLNPFAFPSDTDFRFILLIVSILGASLFAYNIINNYLFQRDYIELSLRCRQVANAAYPGNPSIHSLEGYQKQQLIANCLQPYNLNLATWIGAGMGLLLAVALVLYSIAPSWKIWRGRLTPLTAQDAPEVLAYLEKLCQEVGVDQLPTFVWNPFNLSKSGLAFGRLGHYYVAMPGGLVTLFYTNRLAFRAIMLHELAHLRNADIDKTYFAVAMWQAFVVVTSVPFIGLIVYLIIENPALDETNLSLVDMIWRVVPLAILVYLMRNAVLRTREIYADVRASVWDNDSNVLLTLLSTLPSPKMFVRKFGLSVHPDPNERRELLMNTNRLFSRLGFWDAFATGTAIMITIPNVVLFLSLLVPFNQGLLTTIAPAMLAAALIVGVLGVGVWRSSFALLWESKIHRNIGKLGTGLGLGLILGYALSFDTSSSQSLFPNPLVFYTVIGFLALPVCLFSYLFLRWMAAGASIWLESITTRRLLSRVSVLGYIVAGIILAVCLGALFSILELLPIIGVMGDASLVLLLALISTTLMGLLDWVPILPLISIYPIAAVIRRRQVRTDMQWAFLDASQQLETPRQTPLHPWRAAIVGLLGGVIFCGLLLIIGIVSRITLPENLRNTDSFLQYLQYLNIGAVALAVLTQTVVAVMVAVWIGQLGWVHGLFAAFIAGFFMTVGILGLNWLIGGTITPTFAWNVFSQVVNVGALLALPFALAASAISGWFRRSEVPSYQAVMG